MAAITRRDTRPELALRKALWRRDLRGWRCDVAGLPGRPDVVFTKQRLAIFVDGRLWHGHPSKYPARLSPEWRAKVARNVQRDRRADALLEESGWRVLRFWDAEVIRDPDLCASLVERSIRDFR
jgi:DNA mismatch endonuclease, patch repair protein